MCVEFLIWMGLCICPISYMFWGLCICPIPSMFWHYRICLLELPSIILQEPQSSASPPLSSFSLHLLRHRGTDEHWGISLEHRLKWLFPSGTHKERNASWREWYSPGTELSLCNSWFQRCWPHVTIIRSLRGAIERGTGGTCCGLLKRHL